MTVATVVHVAALVVAAGTTGTLAAYAWRHRDRRGARAFSGFAGALTLFSVAQLVGLLTFHPVWRLVWEHLKWTGAAAIPVLWLLFALEYTGHDGFLDRRTVAALSAVPAGTVVLAWTNGWHHLLMARSVLTPTDGLAILEQSFGPWFWVFLAYAYCLLLAGGVLLVRLVWLSEYLYADQSALLVVGAAVPLVANVLTVVGVTPIRDPNLDLTPYFFTVAGLAFGYALFRHRLFDLVPATRRLGRSAAIRDLDDGVVIVDDEAQVIYCNPAAAALFDADPAATVGEPVSAFVDEAALEFGAADALAEWERDDGVYEVRTSPIRDGERTIGHTVVVRDISGRKRRERRVARQRDELERVEELNEVVRSVNRALVAATSREEIERAVCDRLTELDRYRAVCVADARTWAGQADRWTVAGDEAAPLPRDDAAPLPGEDELAAAEHDDREPAVRTTDGGATDGWTVVPIVYARTVYGALGLLTEADGVGARERGVLAELGELIGHAIDAAEKRQLLSAEAVVELQLRSDDDDDPLLQAARRADATLAVEGVVPAGGHGHLAYVDASDDAPRVAATLAAASSGDAEVVEGGEDGGVVEWSFPSGAPLSVLLDQGANVLEATADADAARYVAEVASDGEVRTLVDRLEGEFPDTSLEAKRSRSRPVERADDVTPSLVSELTDRQREALEVAYRAGYFAWPRESTGEEVAEALDISGPTLHSHLRKAEATLLAELFESDAGE